MKRTKFKDTYKDEINMFSRLYVVSMPAAEDRLFEKFRNVNFDADVFNETTLVEILWSKAK